MPKFNEKKPKASYPIENKTYQICAQAGYHDSKETQGKFLVMLHPTGWLELWESQLDALVPLIGNTKEITVKIVFHNVGTNGKTRLMPFLVTEEL